MDTKCIELNYPFFSVAVASSKIKQISSSDLAHLTTFDPIGSGSVPFGITEVAFPKNNCSPTRQLA